MGGDASNDILSKKGRVVLGFTLHEWVSEKTMPLTRATLNRARKSVHQNQINDKINVKFCWNIEEA